MYQVYFVLVETSLVALGVTIIDPRVPYKKKRIPCRNALPAIGAVWKPIALLQRLRGPRKLLKP